MSDSLQGNLGVADVGVADVGVADVGVAGVGVAAGTDGGGAAARSSRMHNPRHLPCVDRNLHDTAVDAVDAVWHKNPNSIDRTHSH